MSKLRKCLLLPIKTRLVWNFPYITNSLTGKHMPWEVLLHLSPTPLMVLQRKPPWMLLVSILSDDWSIYLGSELHVHFVGFLGDVFYKNNPISRINIWETCHVPLTGLPGTVLQTHETHVHSIDIYAGRQRFNLYVTHAPWLYVWL